MQVEDLGEDTDDDTEKADRAKESFKELAGEDGEVSAYELRDVLNGIFMEGTDEQTHLSSQPKSPFSAKGLVTGNNPPEDQGRIKIQSILAVKLFFC